MVFCAKVMKAFRNIIFSHVSFIYLKDLKSVMSIVIVTVKAQYGFSKATETIKKILIEKLQEIIIS